MFLLRSLQFFADLWHLAARKFAEIPSSESMSGITRSVLAFAHCKCSQVFCQKIADARPPLKRRTRTILNEVKNLAAHKTPHKEKTEEIMLEDLKAQVQSIAQRLKQLRGYL